MNAQDELHHIQQAQRSASAFTPLYEQYVSLVWNYSLARLRDPERAADATSTTFLKAMYALPRYKPATRGAQTTFRSWLMTIARNVVLDELRRRPTSPLDDREYQIPSPEAGPEEIAIARDRRQQLRAAYAQLSDQQQDVLLSSVIQHS